MHSRTAARLTQQLRPAIRVTQTQTPTPRCASTVTYTPSSFTSRGGGGREREGTEGAPRERSFRDRDALPDGGREREREHRPRREQSGGDRREYKPRDTQAGDRGTYSLRREWSGKQEGRERPVGREGSVRREGGQSQSGGGGDRPRISRDGPSHGRSTRERERERERPATTASTNRKPRLQTVTDTIVPQLSQDEVSSIFSQELFVFRCDVTATHIPAAMSSYAQLSEREVLTENDISNLARQLHARFRMDREKKDILPHVITLIEDFKKKAIPGHPLASVHLLSCLKDMEEFTLSNEFWEWLTTQDENFCDARTYGAAIECFSYQGVSLSELEAMWSEALERFSGTTVTSVAKNTGRGVPVMLLQGIITARLFHGDWRAAYEAFDICTRLYPSLTPARIYELFIYERPVREAYIVFLMACRAGTPPKPGVLTPLLKETWMETHDVRAMIRLVYAFVGAGGTPNAIHLNSLIGGILGSFPPELKPTDAEYEPLYHGMLGLVRALITVFNRMGVPLSTGSFNTIISLGGKLRRQELIHSGLKELIDAGLSPTMVTYRTLLNAVGDMADVMLLEESWSMLKTGREQLRVPWDFNDWKALIRACVATGRVDFFEGQLAVHSHELSEIFVRNIIAVLQRAIITSTATPTPTPETAPSTTPLDKQALIAEVKTLTEIFSSRRIADFTRASGSSSSDGSSLSNDDLFSLLPSDTTPSGVTLTAAQEAELHEIYVSIAPPPSVLDTETAGTKTSTGYDIDKLRFENWKAVNRLLFEAEWWEREQERRKVEATRAASGDSIVQEKKGKKEENVGYEFVFWNEERAKKRIFMDMQTVVEGMRKGEPDWRSREMEVRGRLGVGIRA